MLFSLQMVAEFGFCYCISAGICRAFNSTVSLEQRAADNKNAQKWRHKKVPRWRERLQKLAILGFLEHLLRPVLFPLDGTAAAGSREADAGGGRAYER